MTYRERVAFWRGVRAGILWFGGISVGGVMFFYYLLEVVGRFC